MVAVTWLTAALGVGVVLGRGISAADRHEADPDLPWRSDEPLYVADVLAHAPGAVTR
ncbi:hypothetical protein [Modestobacter sp. SYSU DS0657]